LPFVCLRAFGLVLPEKQMCRLQPRPRTGLDLHDVTPKKLAFAISTPGMSRHRSTKLDSNSIAETAESDE
jgi:hypothetical protein